MRTVAEIVWWWAAGVVLWLVTVSVVDVVEIVLAVLASLVCALFARRIRKVLDFHLAPTGSLWRWVSWLPRALVNDLVATVLFVVRALRGRAPIGRRHEHRWPAGVSAEAMTWRAGAAIIVSATPATLVLDVDPDSGDALMHTLLQSHPKLDELVTP